MDRIRIILYYFELFDKVLKLLALSGKEPFMEEVEDLSP
jgi:hypothetical protein